jgi:starch phosphorylase
LHDPERLLRILNNKKRPVQLIIAGKAHPADKDGQQLIKEWIHFIRRSDARSHVIFLSDYDMHMTEHLVQGVDVWINTPKRPWEACGTSGMKVLVNGGINLSEMDGWWAEAYTSDVGWALGDGREHGNDPVYEATEAEQLYTILENEVVPEFYQRNSDGIPNAWVKRMRESMARLTPQFSANRTVRDYTERHYIPAAVAYRLRAAGNSSIGSSIVKWNHDLNEKWGLLTFGNVSVTSNAIEHIFDVEVYLNGLDPDSVSVQLYAEGKHDGDSILLSMHKENTLQETTGISVYHAVASAERPPEDFTVRIIPNCTYISIPLEQSRILWQR